MVLSTGRELQEMDISAVLQSHTRTHWLHDSTELDIKLAHMKTCVVV
jgi:hypothetical protein